MSFVVYYALQRGMEAKQSDCPTDGIVHQHSPSGWDQAEFERLGGFTVVFLNYNKGKFIRESVAAALAQDWPRLEMFFMDDASTDGSGDEMEKIVRAYRGRHKVTVIRNKTNRGITGQWNAVAKLATGNWLGMFCADDVAVADRVTQAARIIAAHPHLKGLCTSGIERNLITGDTTRAIAEGFTSDTARGTDAPWDIAARRTGIVGATAFWHKSLFDVPLPPVPLDDVLLRWILQMKSRDTPDVVWTWDTTTIAITYAIGEGVSSAMRARTGEQQGFSQRWRAAMQSRRTFATLMVRTWTGILSYYRTTAAPKEFLSLARAERFRNRAEASSTLYRLALLPSATRLMMDFRVPVRRRLLLIARYGKRFAMDFFGLRVASVLACIIHRRHQNNDTDARHT